MNFRKSELTKHPELSTRELEVLRLLPKGYANHQIAAELFILVSFLEEPGRAFLEHFKHCHRRLRLVHSKQFFTDNE